MELILALLIGGGCVALGAWAIRRKQSEARTETAAAAANRTLADLVPQDVITHDGIDWMVAGVASLSEGAEHWIEGRLEDAAREGWIVVNASDPDKVLFGERVDDLVVGENPSESLDHRGDVFKLERHGQAQVVAVEGDVARVYAASGDIDCRYWYYQRPGDARIWIRHVGAGRHHFAGRRVARHLVGFLPGS
jgi:hypothetical protein